MSDKNYSPLVPDAYQLALNTINQLADRLDGMTAMYKDEFRYRQLAETRVKTLGDALNRLRRIPAVKLVLWLNPELKQALAAKEPK